MIRVVRGITIAVFGIVLAAWLYTGVMAQWKADKTSPVIQSESDMILLSVEDDASRLFEELSAADDRDGDLTDEIMLGTVSKFSAPGVLEATYLVFDKSNNLATYKRKIEYTDYSSPVFSLREPLVFGVGESTSILEYLTLQDSIDGDISKKIKIVSSTIDTSAPGLYLIGVTGTNAYGDTVQAELPVNIVEKRNGAPEISLSSYLVYLKKGESFRPESYLESIQLADGTKVTNVSAVQIDSQVNMSQAGTYNVLYKYADSFGSVGYTAMTVIVQA